MPLFMDVHHRIDDLTPEARAEAHAKVLEEQARHGVNLVRYWYDEASGKVFCLWEASDKEAANAVHREAHGFVADEMWQVQEVSGADARTPA